MARFRRKPRISRFRRRRAGGTWFPTLGTAFEAEAVYHDASYSGQTQTVNEDSSFGPVQNVFPVTKDFQQFSDTSTQLNGPSLRDVVEGQTWRLNRLVGQLHVDCTEDNAAVTNLIWPMVKVTAGFFVARSSDTDQSLPDLTFDEIDPSNVNNIANSWIWRRNWILSRPLASNVGFTAVPCSNAEMAWGSGPGFDSKVKRNIRREHRLWFVIGAMGWDGNAITHVDPGSTSQPYVRFNLDVRIHGIMKRGRETPSF